MMTLYWKGYIQVEMNTKQIAGEKHRKIEVTKRETNK